MTAVANPPSFQQNGRSAWGASVGQAALNSMNADEVARMFMPRKSAQRANSSSSTSSTSSSSSTATIPSIAPQSNGVLTSTSIDPTSWGTGTAAARKKTQRAGAWPSNKAEAVNGVATTKQPSMLPATSGATTPSLTSIHQPSPILPSQHVLQSPTQQPNTNRPATQPVGEGSPVLYLLSMNGTFERKTISVPFYPDSLRIGRQTNAKTVPTPANGFFDSKVLSRQHAEIWADRNGKIWIRDVKSSNGTFVNGARLSAENRDSEPHELQTQDHLELGIDIVSEDQKTVVHHKVAAKVEHAGFLGTTTNVMDMNFGDLDPANGAMMVPSQGSMQMRGRTNSQGSVSSNGRIGAPTSVAGSQMSQMSQQRPMNFWLTPVTTEQIVKRIHHEMRLARLQTTELSRADHFLETLLSKENVKDMDKPAVPEAPKPPIVNGASLPFRIDSKPRFSDPPAPPPQQPLPEKPDITRSLPVEPISPSLKRSNTERPRSVPNVSPVRQEASSQIIGLVEALATAKKEYEASAARIRDLEEMLIKEREAREMAEETARQLQAQSEIKMNGRAGHGVDGLILEEAFEPPSDPLDTKTSQKIDMSTPPEDLLDTKEISNSSLLLEKRLETMLVDMQAMRQQMEIFKSRAEVAESERDADRKSLAEMVEKIRSDEAARRIATKDRSSKDLTSRQSNSSSGKLDLEAHNTNPPSAQTKDSSAKPGAPLNDKEIEAAVAVLSKSHGARNPLVQSTAPYASMLGVVLIGMGLMVYLNGWQPPKAER